ncbi:hypothetical protein COCCADRAFT_89340 [Bipolaris zeicola 26-R-13]|uniref:Uncharacterized protein n=1 Tax=Cochliobolus carbonum (strain 26-R-13) TaxID=930089 RepID=W6YWU0_COCC2|nr:uncharacterized protein COCCADRAFT_89340 [Bipolaris zeicola 26-R-13]EUC35976.1 hypothetical protein COCCADRAFT_89340 [Bipolaris zeicola 26-R-13]
MKRSSSTRVARKIGSYDDDESADSTNSSQSEVQKPTVVKRPALGKAKKRSSLRMSFGAGDEANNGEESSDSAVMTPKKANLSRIALEKSAQLRARSPLVSESAKPTEYSKDYIAELRNSTPSTPRDLKISAEEEEEIRALDIAAKFGPVASLEATSSAIPTEAEIREKKARRRRLAHEENAYDDEDAAWASDDQGEDEFRQHRDKISLRPKDKWGETRLVHDDEDIAEGFDDYVEDGKIALGRKSEKEAQRRRRAEMAELINDAEGSSGDDGSDDSDEDRNVAFATAQARAGRYGQKVDEDDDGTRTPPRITPLPDLNDILQGLTIDMEARKQRKALLLQKMQDLKDDKVRIEERKKYLQEQLQKTGEEYEKLRQESGLPALPTNTLEGGGGARLITERGLDSLGTTPLGGTPLGGTPLANRSSEDSD